MKPLVLSAALSLAATSVMAQETNPPHHMPIGAQLNRIDTKVEGLRPMIAPVPTARDTSAGVTYPGVAVVSGDHSPYLSDNVSGPTAQALIVKSSPVPDTPAARALYKPLSRGGQRTPAASN
jgi:hypothetical protein